MAPHVVIQIFNLEQREAGIYAEAEEHKNLEEPEEEQKEED